MLSEVHIFEPPGGLGEPWPQARELLEREPEGWVVVGGLMVTLHAHAAGLGAGRPTTDVDALLDVAVTSVHRADDALRALGYAFQPSIDSDAPAHRWRREADGAVVDILVPDHLPRPPRFQMRATVAAPGGTSVLKRHLSLAVVHGERPVRLCLPSLAGAWVLKSDAYLADSRDKARHLEDLSLLIAAAPDFRLVVTALSKSDRRRIRAVLPALFEHLQRIPDQRARAALVVLPHLAREVGLQDALPTSTGPAPLGRRRRAPGART